MDVRCDRCQTEYELDDASVTERGASVQCTTCGHTFTVSRPRAEFTPTPSPTTEAAPAWVLTTEEGKVHRFRDPTTLQKWIVERRVGRNDRVTAPGASARRLGDMDELRPFFDLVDQADRTSAARVARPTQPETPQRLGAGRGYVSPDEDDDDMLMGRRSRGGQRDRVSRLDSDIAAGLTTMGMDDSMGVVLPRRNTARNVALGLLALGGIAGGFYFGTRSGGLAKVGVASSPAVAPAPAAAPPAPPPAPPVAAAPAPAAAAPAAPPPAAAPAAPAPAAVPAAPPSAPVAAAKHAPPPEDVPDPPASARSPSGRSASAAPSTGGAMPHRYEQLVAEANRALENGNTAKAQKFVDEALKLQPSGVSAVTASAYLLLDRRKPLAAVGEFKRALNNAPNFPQALFGLGEAYRSAGDTSQAIDAYKKYLAAAPGRRGCARGAPPAARARDPAGASQPFVHDGHGARPRFGQRTADAPARAPAVVRRLID
jgi:predicted Zn finger-like uncharacterized protein